MPTDNYDDPTTRRPDDDRLEKVSEVSIFFRKS